MFCLLYYYLPEPDVARPSCIISVSHEVRVVVGFLINPVIFNNHIKCVRRSSLSQLWRGDSGRITTQTSPDGTCQQTSAGTRTWINLLLVTFF